MAIVTEPDLLAADYLRVHDEGEWAVFYRASDMEWRLWETVTGELFAINPELDAIEFQSVMIHVIQVCQALIDAHPAPQQIIPQGLLDRLEIVMDAVP